MSSEGLVVAVLGATGVVGRKIMDILEERHFPVKTLKPLASHRSAGKTVLFKGQQVPIQAVSADAFDGVDLVLSSAGASVSTAWAKIAVSKGAVVVDNTSLFRLEPDVPLVLSGVNDDDLAQHQGIVANPNCSTSQLMPVLKALDEAAGLERVIISTYQSVSGAGKEGMDELVASTQDALTQPTYQTQQHQKFQRPIAFNLVPHIDVFLDEATYGPELADYTKEEAKLVWESRKMLHRPDLKITATAVRVPVMIGHSESVTVDLKQPLSPAQAAELLAQVPDVVVAQKREDYPTPMEIAGSDPVYVGRIRRDSSNPTHGLHFWVVADNLRIGAALNAVRIAEQLVARNLVKVPATV
jgi:aspartate-semialdehyde dehydrogenase